VGVQSLTTVGSGDIIVDRAERRHRRVLTSTSAAREWQRDALGTVQLATCDLVDLVLRTTGDETVIDRLAVAGQAFAHDNGLGTWAGYRWSASQARRTHSRSGVGFGDRSRSDEGDTWRRDR
jgi:hypothetical protein